MMSKAQAMKIARTIAGLCIAAGLIYFLYSDKFVLDLAGGLREVALSAGRLLVIPTGVWHTAKVSEPGRLLAITAGSGTQHRPV
jgi:hypothetical protein